MNQSMRSQHQNAAAGNLKAGTNWKANNFYMQGKQNEARKLCLLNTDSGANFKKVQSFAQCTISKAFTTSWSRSTDPNLFTCSSLFLDAYGIGRFVGKMSMYLFFAWCLCMLRIEVIKSTSRWKASPYDILFIFDFVKQKRWSDHVRQWTTGERRYLPRDCIHPTIFHFLGPCRHGVAIGNHVLHLLFGE